MLACDDSNKENHLQALDLKCNEELGRETMEMVECPSVAASAVPTTEQIVQHMMKEIDRLNQSTQELRCKELKQMHQQPLSCADLYQLTVAQPPASISTWTIMCEWLLKSTRRLRIRNEVLQGAFMYLYRYLCVMYSLQQPQLAPGDTALVLLSCLVLAHKMYGGQPVRRALPLMDVLKETQMLAHYTVDHMKRCEVQVMMILARDLLQTTPLGWYKCFQEALVPWHTVFPELLRLNMVSTYTDSVQRLESLLVQGALGHVAPLVLAATVLCEHFTESRLHHLIASITGASCESIEHAKKLYPRANLTPAPTQPVAAPTVVSPATSASTSIPCHAI